MEDCAAASGVRASCHLSSITIMPGRVSRPPPSFRACDQFFTPSHEEALACSCPSSASHIEHVVLEVLSPLLVNALFPSYGTGPAASSEQSSWQTFAADPLIRFDSQSTPPSVALGQYLSREYRPCRVICVDALLVIVSYLADNMLSTRSLRFLQSLAAASIKNQQHGLPRLTLLTGGPECSLCEVAFDRLLELQHGEEKDSSPEKRFELERVNIRANRTDPFLKKARRLWQYDIPVLLLDGQYAMKHRIDEAKLATLLEAQPSAAPPRTSG